MKKVILIIFLFVAFSCKDENKKEEYVGPEEIDIDNNAELFVLDTLDVSNSKKWNLKNTAIDSTNQEIDGSILSRIEQNNSSYIITNAVKALKGSNYRVTILAKRNNNSALGLRITGVYPNRADAIFDLEKGIVVGTSSNGEFNDEKAIIEIIDDNWYKCVLSSEVHADKISVFFGPTSSKTIISNWESGNSIANDVNVITDSIILEETSF